MLLRIVTTELRDIKVIANEMTDGDNVIMKIIQITPLALFQVTVKTVLFMLKITFST